MKRTLWSFAPERAWVSLGSPCYICICFVSDCWWLRQRCEVCPQTACDEVRFTPTGSQTSWVVAQKYTCKGCVPVESVDPLVLQSISGDQLYRLFTSWRLGSVTSSTAGELGCVPGRGSREDAAGKGLCAEAGWDVLLTKTRVWKRFVLLCARWVELLGLVNPGWIQLFQLFHSSFCNQESYQGYPGQLSLIPQWKPAFHLGREQATSGGWYWYINDGFCLLVPKAVLQSFV